MSLATRIALSNARHDARNALATLDKVRAVSDARDATLATLAVKHGGK